MTENDTPLNIAYLGPEASFSHQAAIGVFEPRRSSSSSSTSSPSASQTLVTLHPLPSFSAIFSAIQNASSPSHAEKCQAQISYDYAVVPIENSTNGSVVQVLDLLAQCGLDSGAKSESAATVLYPDLEVCAEYYLPVHHCLFVASTASTAPTSQRPTGDSTTAEPLLEDPKTSIRTLYTHPQVWGQCGRFLTAHFPPNVVERIDVGSTSAAAQLVAREASSNPKTETGSGISAAIASKLAGERHNLVCLAENIEDEPGSNTTRFLVLRNRKRQQCRGPSSRHEPWVLPQNENGKKSRYFKSLITFTIDHTRPGSLADALAVFRQYSFNLTSIDTRPGRKRNWQYVFFVECEEETPNTAQGAQDDQEQPNLTNMLQDLRKFTESLRYLGRFEDQLRSDTMME